MRKRPLCFWSITLVLIIWILQTSGEGDSSSDVIFPKESQAVVYGKIYQCDMNEDHQILYLKQTVLSVDSQKQKINNIRITCSSETPKYMVSDFVCAKGCLNEWQAASNPGQFDVRSYYQAQKVGFTMWEPQLELLERPSFSFTRMLFDIRKNLAEQYEKMLPNQYGELLKGITLGEKTGISDETKELFQKGGISHILAISALHLQILGNSLYSLLRKCRIPIWLSAVFAGTVLISYGVLTGASVATLRALIMFLLNIGGDVTGRTYDGMTGMALAAVVLVAGNPDYLLYSGFWLSFIAVCAFMIFKERRKLAGGILLYVFMAPITLVYFYELSLYSVFLNLFVVPTMGVVLVSGIAGCIAGLFHLVLGKILVFPAAMILCFYRSLCEINESLPWNVLVFGKPSWVQVLLYYGILAITLFLFRKNRLRKIRFAILACMIPAWLILTHRHISELQITMLDVGQGDCMIIQTETENTYLVDGGSTSEERVGNYRIVPYLKYSGVTNVEAVFLTHADQDHMNGIQELLEMIADETIHLSIEKIVLPYWLDMGAFSEICNLAKQCDIEVCKMGRGGTLSDGDLDLLCLHPNGEAYLENKNEGSLVLRLEYKEFSMLFTGDLEDRSESRLLGEYGDVDILKVAHHGSGNSTSETFLMEVRPEISLISCGENNRYGHPHDDLLVRLKASGSKIFQTPKCGALTIRTDGEKIDLKTYKQYNIFEDIP